MIRQLRQRRRASFPSKYSLARELSKAGGPQLIIDFVPNARISGDRTSRGHVYHASVFHGHYELDLDGNGAKGVNVIPLDGRRGRVEDLLVVELRRCAAFYARLAVRVEGQRACHGVDQVQANSAGKRGAR
jgi:hypothetical protein